MSSFRTSSAFAWERCILTAPLFLFPSTDLCVACLDGMSTCRTTSSRKSTSFPSVTKTPSAKPRRPHHARHSRCGRRYTFCVFKGWVACTLRKAQREASWMSLVLRSERSTSSLRIVGPRPACLLDFLPIWSEERGSTRAIEVECLRNGTLRRPGKRFEPVGGGKGSQKVAKGC